MHSTPTRKRTGLVGAGTVLVDLLPVAAVLTEDEPLPLGVVLVTVDRGAGVVDSTGRLVAPLDWTTPPHSELVHLNAGRSSGIGGGVPVFEGGGVDVGGGIVGGGIEPACTLRGITAKFG